MKLLIKTTAFIFIAVCALALAYHVGRLNGREDVRRDVRSAVKDDLRASWCDGVFWGWTVGRTGANHGQLLARAWWVKEVAAKDPAAKPTIEAHDKIMKQGADVKALSLLDYDDDPAAP